MPVVVVVRDHLELSVNRLPEELSRTITATGGSLDKPDRRADAVLSVAIDVDPAVWLGARLVLRLAHYLPLARALVKIPSFFCMCLITWR